MHFKEVLHAVSSASMCVKYDVIKRGAIKYRVTCSNYSHFLIFQFVCTVKTFCCNYPI